ncbi:unnamed protein product [Adineta steineri]|uniref:Proteasome activator complex subunit 4 n=1 Tax=Adineta steineri TaxID=433720 RepID=A0A819PYD9_9BILA|nr:unnamed protein product [Adineta steineri]
MATGVFQYLAKYLQSKCVGIMAWHNIGYIDWEPWLSQIFTRILRGFSLPMGKPHKTPQRYPHFVPEVAKWIVAMIGNRSSCLQYLADLLISIRSFYHPSNMGKFQKNLVEFLLKLTTGFSRERKAHPVWFFTPLSTHRLTEDNITDFVNCLKEYVFISIFNQDYMETAVEACHYLSILRPELIIPSIVEKHFWAIDSMTEPHRFTSIITCLTHIARQIVQQTPSYSQGQIYVLPLLISVLPGIDLNDFKKTSVTLEFLDTMLMQITCIDCSSAVNIRIDLTEIEREVCLSTSKFEDFINEFLNRIFHIIEISSAEISDAVTADANDNKLDIDIQPKVTSIIFNIVQQCSSPIFQKIRVKIINFLSSQCLSPKVRDIASGLVRALVKGNPVETLKYLLPEICKSIENKCNNFESTLLTDYKDDIELTWYLVVFAELLRARGDVLLIYKQLIMSVFHQYIQIVNKNSYNAVAKAVINLLESLSCSYPVDYRLLVINSDESFDNFLPIRLWGQYVDIDKVQPQFHIPSNDEIDFVYEFVETFLYPELARLNEKGLKMSNNERLRSLTIIRSIAVGVFCFVPPIESKEVQNLMVQSMVPHYSKYQIRLSKNSTKLKCQENLRLRLFIDIGLFLDKLVENHSDDVLSIQKALGFYRLISSYYGIYEHGIYDWSKDFNSREELSKNKLCGEGQNLRFLIIQKMALKIKELETTYYGPLNEINKEIIFKLFELSINRYSAVRRNAQNDLFYLFNRIPFSYQVVVDRIVELLKSTSEPDHDQIKGCLYLLLGNNNFFLPTKYSWTIKEKLWPLIAHMTHTKKTSTQKLIEDIYKKISKQFATDIIIQNTNEKSICAAKTLWRSLEANEMQKIEEYNQNNIESYNRLMETLSLLLKDSSLTWKEQEITLSLLCDLRQNRVPMPLSCIETFLDCLIHDHVEIRKLAIIGIISLCRLQKPPHINVEKSLEEILSNNGQPLPHITTDQCHPGDREDNLWLTFNDYKPPETQIEWEEACFLDKPFHGYYTWPKIIKYPMNKRARYAKDHEMPKDVTILYDRFMSKQFVRRITQLMILNENEEQKNFDKNQFVMFKGLFRNFGLAFFDNFMEQLNELVHEKITKKQEGSHRVAAQIVAGMICGSKNWTLEMLNELWEKLTPFLTEVCNNLNSEVLSHWNACFFYMIINKDPRRMFRVIHFLCTLINAKSTLNTFNESARWCLIRNLDKFHWRIPSVWCEVYKHIAELLDHSSLSVRTRIAYVLALSMSHDVTLLDGQSTRQPNINVFLDTISERLNQAIEICERLPINLISDQILETDLETQKAFNFIETVVLTNSDIFYYSQQPIKNGIIRLFPFLCEIKSIAGCDENFKTRLTASRQCVGISYLNLSFLNTFVQQLSQICVSTKWHASRAAIEFVQTMIFCNLFNARPYVKQVHELILKCLSDEHFEVRIAARSTLSDLYQCGYIQITSKELNNFGLMSKTNYFMKIDGKKVILSNNMIKRHAGVLGLCAIVLSSPYDIPAHVPDALMLLCKHLDDPGLIQKSIKQCLSEFRRTHHDSWHEHRERFTQDQLVILADALVSHNYYI